MAGYVNPDGQARLVTKIFGNVGGKTVRAKSLWTNKDGVATCIYREGERDVYVVGLKADIGNGVFPMAYSYDMNVFRPCSIIMPSGYESRKPNAIEELFYSKELGLFVALGWYIASNSSSTMYWYMLYSEDGKSWEVALTNSVTYSSISFNMVYDEKNRLFFVVNKSQSDSTTGTKKYYCYCSSNGIDWIELRTISPEGGNSYTSRNVLEALSPGDGYIYLSGTSDISFSEDYDSYYPFIRTEDGINFIYYKNGLDYTDVKKLYGSRSLIYNEGIYYSLGKGMLSDDQNSLGIYASFDNMNTWQYVALESGSSVKDFKGSTKDGFFLIGNELFCSISKSETETYIYKENSDGTWSKQFAKDYIFGKDYDYIYIPISEGNIFQLGSKFYRTHSSRLSSTEDGVEYIEESTLSASMRAPFSLNSSSNYVIAVKMTD